MDPPSPTPIVRPTNSNAQPVTNTSHHPGTSIQPDTTTSHPATTTFPPLCTSTQPATDASCPSVTTAQPVTTSSLPSGNSLQPANTTSCPPGTSNQPATTTFRPPDIPIQPATSTSCLVGKKRKKPLAFEMEQKRRKMTQDQLRSTKPEGTYMYYDHVLRYMYHDAGMLSSYTTVHIRVCTLNCASIFNAYRSPI